MCKRNKKQCNLREISRKMFTKLTLRTFIIFFKIGSFTNSIPYEWDKKEGKVIVQKSKLKLCLWSLQLIWIYISTINLIFSLRKGIEANHIPNIVIDFIFAYAGGIISLYHWNNLIYFEEVPQFINAYLDFDRDFTGNTSLSFSYPLGQFI